MKTYIELFEISEDPEPDFVRVEVTDWSIEDIYTLIGYLKDFAVQNYKNFLLQRHFCFHDVGKPCTTEVLF